MKDIITLDYEGMPVTFTEDGFFNATEVAAKYGKKPAQWLRLLGTQEYIKALCRFHAQTKVSVQKKHTGPVTVDEAVLTVVGGASPGTWLHPKLGVAFARWLDAGFAVWCDDKIDLLIHGQNPTLEMQLLLRDLEGELEQLRDQTRSVDALRKTLERAARVTERALPKPLPEHKDAKMSPVAEQINKAIWAAHGKEVPLSDFHTVNLTDEDVIKYASEVSAKKTTLGLLNGALKPLSPRGGQPVASTTHLVLGSSAIN